MFFPFLLVFMALPVVLGGIWLSGLGSEPESRPSGGATPPTSDGRVSVDPLPSGARADLALSGIHVAEVDQNYDEKDVALYGNFAPVHHGTNQALFTTVLTCQVKNLSSRPIGHWEDIDLLVSGPGVKHPVDKEMMLSSLFSDSALKHRLMNVAPGQTAWLAFYVQGRVKKALLRVVDEEDDGRIKPLHVVIR